MEYCLGYKYGSADQFKAVKKELLDRLILSDIPDINGNKRHCVEITWEEYQQLKENKC